MIRVALGEKQVEELEGVFRETDDRKLRDRVQIVLMTHRGRPREQVAADLAVTTRTVQRWLNAYLEKGLEALRPRKAKGAKAKLAESLAEDVRRWVIEGPAKQGLDRANWTYEELAAYLGTWRGVRIRKSAVAEFCRKHGIRPYRPTYRYLRGDAAEQAAAAAELAELKKRHERAGSCC